MVNLVEEGFDVGVRIGQLADSSVIARRLAAVRLVTCASPDYLQAAGAPHTPDDLAKHEAILDSNMRDPTTWIYGGRGEHEVRVHGRLKFGGADACVTAARRGLGIAYTPAFAAAEDLRAGRLTPLLCAYEPQLVHVHAVYPHARHLAAKVRVFVDFLADRFAGEPEWHQGWGEISRQTEAAKA
jgi:DNA-binding transcriptional LysR family regulator